MSFLALEKKMPLYYMAYFFRTFLYGLKMNLSFLYGLPSYLLGSLYGLPSYLLCYTVSFPAG